MKDSTSNVTAAAAYAVAYEAHYKAKTLHKAIELYSALLAAHPNATEAGYAKAQIQNIVNTAVPKPEFFQAQIALALAHIKPED